MAKDSSNKLSVSELRRRLQTAPTAAPVSFPDVDLLANPPPVAPPPAKKPEPTHGMDFELLPTIPPTASPNQTPVPMARLTPTDFQRSPRPTGGTSHGSQLPGPNHFDGYQPDPDCALFGGSGEHNLDAEELRQENESMKQLLEEMRLLLQEASEQEQRTQEQLLATQAELQSLREEVANKPKTPDELEEWSDELEKESSKLQQERRRLDEDRKQMREDEATLEKQMRDMEVQMARERAMLARQEQELKRLNAEIQHELESLQRGDGVLRDRLAVFQRKHAEVTGTPTASGTIEVPPTGSYAGFTASPVAPLPQASTATPTPRKSDTTGLLRKLFRGDS